MKKVILLSMILMCFFSISTFSLNIEDWNYKSKIIINNPGPELLYYQIPITIFYLSGMNQDFSDIRFTTENGVDIPYWIESKENGKRASVWIKVPSLKAYSDTIIYIYYGNPSANTESNGDAVFEFFDDFDDGIYNTDKWNAPILGPGTYSESNGVLKLTVTGNINPYRALSKNYIFTNGIIEQKARYTYSSGVPHIMIYFRQYAFGNPLEFTVRGGNLNDIYFYDGSYKGGVNFISRINDWYFMQIKINGAQGWGYVKNLNTGTSTNTYVSNLFGPSTGYIGPGVWNAQTTVEYDWFRVRKYTSVEPSVTCEPVNLCKASFNTQASIIGTLGNNNWYVSNVKISFTSEAETIEYSFDGVNWQIYSGQFEISTEGIKTIYYRGKTGEIVEDANSLTIKIDKTMPYTYESLQCIYDEYGWCTSPATLILTSSDMISGPAIIYYKTSEEASWNQYTYTTPLKLNFNYSTTVYYYSVDTAGIPEIIHSIEIKFASDSDKDGIPDSIDPCPTVVGKYGGCKLGILVSLTDFVIDQRADSKNPKTTKTPLNGINIRIYKMSDLNAAGFKSASWENYNEILASNVKPIAKGITHNDNTYGDGTVMIGVPNEDNYLVLSELIVSNSKKEVAGSPISKTDSGWKNPGYVQKNLKYMTIIPKEHVCKKDGICEKTCSNDPDCPKEGQCNGGKKLDCPRCGDGICDRFRYENEWTCSKDCGLPKTDKCGISNIPSTCGNGICENDGCIYSPLESCESCPQDCYIKDLVKCYSYTDCSSCYEAGCCWHPDWNLCSINTPGTQCRLVICENIKIASSITGGQCVPICNVYPDHKCPIRMESCNVSNQYTCESIPGCIWTSSKPGGGSGKGQGCDGTTEGTCVSNQECCENPLNCAREKCGIREIKCGHICLPEGSTCDKRTCIQNGYFWCVGIQDGGDSACCGSDCAPWCTICRDACPILTPVYTKPTSSCTFDGICDTACNSDSDCQAIVKNCIDCKTTTGQSIVVKGSELEIIIPEGVYWTETSELYPFVLVSDSDWEVNISLITPVGLEPLPDYIIKTVSNETESVIFNIIKTGTKPNPIEANIALKHGKEKKVIKVPIKTKFSKEVESKSQKSPKTSITAKVLFDELNKCGTLSFITIAIIFGIIGFFFAKYFKINKKKSKL